MGRKPYKKRVSPNIEEGVFMKENIIESQVIDDSVISELKDVEVEMPSAPEHKPVTRPISLYQIRVDHSSLRRRAEPSLEGEVLGYITDKGMYNIYSEVGGWGKLEDGSWIMLQYTSKIKK